MEIIDINTTLAGVEGKCWKYRWSGNSYGERARCLCGQLFDGHEAVDYTTDLNACMRVADLLGIDEVTFCNISGRIFLRWVVTGGVVENRGHKINGNKPLTLSTMLAEIAKEQ